MYQGEVAVQPCGLKRHLIVDAVRADVRSRTRRDGLAIQHIDEPSRFVVCAVVAHVSQCDAEIEGIAPVQIVDCLNCGIQNLRRVEHDRRVDGCIPQRIWIGLLEVYKLIGRLLVGGMDIREGEEPEQPYCMIIGRPLVGGGHQVRALHDGQAGAERPLSVSELVISRNLGEFLLVEARRQGSRKGDHPLARRHGGGGDRIAPGPNCSRHWSQESGQRCGAQKCGRGFQKGSPARKPRVSAERPMEFI